MEADGDDSKYMIIFKGRIHFNPSTLNNLYLAYFLADSLQKDPHYQYSQWEDLVLKSSKLSNDFDLLVGPRSKALANNVVQLKNSGSDVTEPQKQESKTTEVKVEAKTGELQLFKSWSVYGDGTAFTDLDVVAVFNPLQSSFIKKAPEVGKKVSPEVGTHKSNMADQDTDSQMMSKWFGNTLVLADSVVLNLEPVSFTNIHFRVLNSRPSLAFNADWYTQQASVSLKPEVSNLDSYPTLKKMYDIVSSKDSKFKFAFRCNQYRYNNPTKESQAVGFLELIDKQLHPVQSANWRRVGVWKDPKDDLTSVPNMAGDIWFKQMKGGILVDFASFMKDLNLKNGLPFYPEKLEMDLFIPQLSRFSVFDCKNLMEERGGLQWVPNARLPEDRPIANFFNDPPGKATIVEFDRNPDIDGSVPLLFQYSIQEFEFVPEIVERFKKTKVSNAIQQTYEEFIEYDIYCSRYGKPFTGMKTFALSTKTPGDNDGVNNYLNVAAVKERIKMLIDAGVEPYAKKDVNKVIEEVYGSAECLNKIVETANKVNSLRVLSKDGRSWDFLLPKDSKSTDKFWMLRPHASQSKSRVQIQFKDGKGKFKVELNEKLTDKNNPRADVFDSLCLTGYLQDILLTGKTGMTVDFTAMFFQNPSSLTEHQLKKHSNEKEIDWVHYVGPKLRVMAMMYPAMQRLANLYELKVSMQAMRRVFSIEDEKNPRYMPSTREMSPTVHRNIWKWLYSGYYNHQTLNPGWHTKIEMTRTGFTPSSFRKSVAEQVKEQLIDKLHNAFRLEFGTIPLYLTAMYSVKPGGAAENVFRSVVLDEMKHLCIVSNLLLALGSAPDYLNNVPAYPLQLPGVFQHAQKHIELSNPVDLLPCNDEQLRRFLMIEYPTEIENMILVTENLSEPTRQRMQQLRNFLEIVREEIDSNPSFRTIGMFYEDIRELLWQLYDLFKDNPQDLFNGNPVKQFTYFMPGMTPIYDIKTALDQIGLIVEEGEGSHVFDLKGEINKESHFFKFIELYVGCKTLDIKSDLPPGAVLNAEKFLITFTDKDVKYEQSDIQKEWDPKTVEQTRKEIAEEIQKESIGSTKNYNLYTDPAFHGVFREMVAELHKVFNFAPAEGTPPQVYDVEQLRLFENAVSKMKQMSMIARLILRPNMEPSVPSSASGIPPNFAYTQSSGHNKH